MSKVVCHNHIPCIILVGMPGAGKSTVGKLLAENLGWAFLDTDNLIEALYGARLQDIADFFGKEGFLDMECAMVCALRASRCVIATGGSVVYRQPAMEHLAALGTLVWLDLSLETVKARIALNPERGLAIAPGQSLEDLHNERRELYARAAPIRCDSDLQTAEQCVESIRASLRMRQDN